MFLWVEPHYRIRDGRIQHVRGHWRRWPRKRSSTLVPLTHPSVA
jgi:hypothetical protein